MKTQRPQANGIHILHVPVDISKQYEQPVDIIGLGDVLAVAAPSEIRVVAGNRCG